MNTDTGFERSSERWKQLAAKFHAHLDVCKQCAEQPFNLCAEGHRIMVGDGKADTEASS